ncbi:hypothetical protein EVAR_33432_1 [Eumeta japonica]|uniref:Uncharacterized protein n=1 Tax=Eumeta variegata TaxID=151549 RepID=A0A4C1W4A3_EUMVA|nr:hypothetical protein EVAR_33432_1 [Eumeta japonica]
MSIRIAYRCRSRRKWGRRRAPLGRRKEARGRSAITYSIRAPRARAGRAGSEITLMGIEVLNMVSCFGDMQRLFTKFPFCKSGPFAQLTGWDSILLLEDKVCMKENNPFCLSVYLFVRGISEMAEQITMRSSLGAAVGSSRGRAGRRGAGGNRPRGAWAADIDSPRSRARAANTDVELEIDKYIEPFPDRSDTGVLE